MADNYSDQYIESTFFIWHKRGKKISLKLSNSLPVDEHGNRPTPKTIEKWRDTFGWIERADILDVEISKTLERQAIDERIAMYREHEEVADSLITRGREFLEEHPIQDMDDALKAISLGIDIHRRSVAQGTLGEKILSMTDEQLTKELNKLLSPQKENEEFIDAPIEMEEEK